MDQMDPPLCRAAGCETFRHSPLPETLADLQAGGALCPLDHDLEELALLGTAFEDVLISTRNGGALLVQQGGYGPLQTCGDIWRISPRRATLRVSSSAPVQVMRLAPNDQDATGQVRGAVLVADAAGRIMHRVQYRMPQDEMVAMSLVPRLAEDEPPTFPAAQPANVAGTVVSLSAVRQARNDWIAADPGQHLNDLMQSGGQARCRMLPHIGSERAWQVVPQILESFLCYLARRGQSHSRMVPGGAGIIQMTGGTLSKVQRVETLLLAEGQPQIRQGQPMRGSMLTLDLEQIDRIWVIASGAHWQLELYDVDETCLAILGPDPQVSSVDWRDLLVSLPRRRD
jgi:putative heme degradation protein